MPEPLKTIYEFIQFFEVESKPKTKVYSCVNKKSGEELGRVQWFGSWRQYVYFPTVRAVYSKGCLKDICDFIEQLKEVAHA